MIERIEHEFPPGIYGRRQIKSLSPQAIDSLLASGWFRNGNFAVTSICNPVEGEWRASVMLRIVLEDFIFKKRHNKLLQKNKELFTITIQPYQPSKEKESLWQKFKFEIHNWPRIPSFDFHVFRGLDTHHVNTKELLVHYEGNLVAFSIFDEGLTSLASIEAAWHPEYRKHSLGFFTMLLEISHAIETGRQYYYPGIMAKGLSMFQYKLRPGSIQFFRLFEKKWVSWEHIQNSDWLFESANLRLSMLAKLLYLHDWSAAFCYHMLPFQNDMAVSPAEFNICLLIRNKSFTDDSRYFLAGWQPLQDQFFLFDVNVLLLHEFSFAAEQSIWLLIRSIIKNSFIGTCTWPSDVLKLIKDSRG